VLLDILGPKKTTGTFQFDLRWLEGVSNGASKFD